MTGSLRAGALCLGLLCLGGFSTACGSGSETPPRPQGSALLVDPARGSLSGSEMARLKRHGVTELFLEALRIGPDGVPAPSPGLDDLTLPPGTEATLVVRGGFGEEVEALAERLAEVRWTVENQGLVPRGVHLETPSPKDPEAAARSVEELREALPPGTPISGRLDPATLDEEGVEDWARSLDFVTARLYGSPPEEPEPPGAWSFEAVRRGAERLEALGRPWLLEAVILGRVLRLDARDGIVDGTSDVAVTEIFWNPRLELRPGFTLDGSNRRIYTLEVQKSTEVAGWRLRPGEALRVTRPATSDLEGLLRLLDAMALRHHLGQLYHRLAAPSEGLSLSASNLANALDAPAATPDLHARAAVQRRAPGAWLFRFALENRNEELTELSLIDNNYLEVRVSGGTFGSVETGDFYRYDLFRSVGDRLERSFRGADVLRLHVALLAGRGSVQTGEVEIRVSGSPELRLGGRFLLPDGRTIRVEPAVWLDGELTEPEATTGSAVAAGEDAAAAAAGEPAED